MPELTLIRGTGPMEDDDIKAIARAGDRRRAADLVVRKYREPILRHAAYILKDYEEAVDVAHEVFIKAMRERRFFQPDFKMKAWLYRVTSNLCFNMVRDRKRRQAILDGMDRKTSSAPMQMDTVFSSQQQGAIFEALERLSEDHRKILMLRYYGDLSYAEIADTLEIKLGTVMSRLSRAKSRLVDVLDGERVSWG